MSVHHLRGTLKQGLIRFTIEESKFFVVVESPTTEPGGIDLRQNY